MSPLLNSFGGLSARGFGFGAGPTTTPFTLTGSYDALATVTVPSGGASSITFSAIPQTGYKHLQIRMFAQNTVADDTSIQFNSDTGSNYGFHYLYGNGSSVGSGPVTPSTSIGWKTLSATANIFSAGILDLLDYTNTNKYKTTRALSGDDFNGSGTLVMHSGLWRNTNAVNSITIFPNSGNLTRYSSFASYGVK